MCADFTVSDKNRPIHS